MTTDTGIADPNTAHIALKLCELLTNNRTRNDLVDIQTELIIMTVRASDNKCDRYVRALLHHLLQDMRAQIDSRAKT